MIYGQYHQKEQQYESTINSLQQQVISLKQEKELIRSSVEIEFNQFIFYNFIDYVNKSNQKSLIIKKRFRK